MEILMILVEKKENEKMFTVAQNSRNFVEPTVFSDCISKEANQHEINGFLQSVHIKNNPIK